MSAVFKRELYSYFNSAVGYVFLVVFYFFSGLYFFMNNLISNSGSVTAVLNSMFTISIFLIPVLTMRLFSEEFKGKTDQLLLTSPVRLYSLVYGKFFAAYVMFILGAAVTLLYSIIISFFVSISVLEMVTATVGFLLLGGAMIAIGIFISSLTRNQIIAAVISFGIFLLLMYMDLFTGYIPFTWLKSFLSGMSFLQHFNTFVSGIIDVFSITFFVSVIIGFNFLTVKSLERKRFS